MGRFAIGASLALAIALLTGACGDDGGADPGDGGRLRDDGGPRADAGGSGSDGGAGVDGGASPDGGSTADGGLDGGGVVDGGDAMDDGGSDGDGGVLVDAAVLDGGDVDGGGSTGVDAGSTGVSCSGDRDCRAYSFQCDGRCECLALGASDPDPPCSSPVLCFVDPCEGRTAECVDGECAIVRAP